MIAICHLLLGAAIVTKIKFLPLAFFLAFLSHYLLDFIPHWEYSVKNIKERQWKKSFPDFLKIILDICLGILLILIFLKNLPVIFMGAFFAVLADGFNLANFIFPNKILGVHYSFKRKIHLFENKKISIFWRIFSQVLVVLTVIFWLVL